MIHGLDEEYHNIDISEAKDTADVEAEEFHIVPTQDTSLAPAPSLLDAGSLGSIDSAASSGLSPSHPRHRGRAASFLEGKGFGWLLEVEEEEEDAKPLL